MNEIHMNVNVKIDKTNLASVHIIRNKKSKNHEKQERAYEVREIRKFNNRYDNSRPLHLIRILQMLIFENKGKIENKLKFVNAKASYDASRYVSRLHNKYNKRGIFFGKDGDYYYKKMPNIEKKYREYLENYLRRKLNLPHKGEGWYSETLLKNYINELLKNHKTECTFHYRPKYLRGKELDIYFEIDGKKIGIEYQGKQHFEPVKFFGGIEAFKSLKKRDLQKKIICKKQNIILIYFTYRDALTFDEIKNRIQFQAGINFKT